DEDIAERGREHTLGHILGGGGIGFRMGYDDVRVQTLSRLRIRLCEYSGDLGVRPCRFHESEHDRVLRVRGGELLPEEVVDGLVQGRDRGRQDGRRTRVRVVGVEVAGRVDEYLVAIAEEVPDVST